MNLSRDVRNFTPSSSTPSNNSVNEHIDKYNFYRHQFWNFLIQWQFAIYHSVSGNTILSNSEVALCRVYIYGTLWAKF